MEILWTQCSFCAIKYVFDVVSPKRHVRHQNRQKQTHVPRSAVSARSWHVCLVCLVLPLQFAAHSVSDVAQTVSFQLLGNAEVDISDPIGATVDEWGVSL